MRFTKMHGAGNDYVYVDLFEEEIPGGIERDLPNLAEIISDRHTGIGADGLILMTRTDSADVKMIMYNADGSRAQMCGNGVRCLAHLARDHGRVDGDVVRVETDDGIKTVQLLEGAARVDMGPPRLDPGSLPVDLPGPPVIDHGIDLLDRTFAMTCVSMGNPHAVIYVDRVADFDVARYGAALENDPLFAERTNVEFVEIIRRDRVVQRTWERGSGETLACGTGACAVCVAGVVSGRTDRKLHNQLLGGELLLEWPADDASVIMTGPVVTVFTGEWNG
jgi:diaminopimelate epimerase